MRVFPHKNPHYDIENFRGLSCFLETEVPNVSLCGIVCLDIDSDELTGVLNDSRIDREFSEFRFIKRKSIREFMLDPSSGGSETLKLHPTSMYRLYFTYLHNYDYYVPE